MKIHVISDTHSEFESFEFRDTDSDVVVLAGDINLKSRGVEWALDTIKHKPVIYVLGNHEYYSSAYPRLLGKLKALSKNTNVHVLENDGVQIDQVRFLGCTLWTDFKLFGDPRLTGYDCQQLMNDYKKIRLSPRFSKLRSVDVATINQHSTNWLKNELMTENAAKTVVVTHHAPSILSMPEHLRGNTESAAYASNFEELIESTQPDLWIHGHIHCSNDYLIDNTRIVCNPRGYPDERNSEFREDFIVTV